MGPSTKIALSLLFLLVGLWAVLDFSGYIRDKELDHLDDRIPFGRLSFGNKYREEIGDLILTTQDKTFSLTFKGQQLFVGNNLHFVVLMKAQGQIASQGDSFYHVKDSINRKCKVQKIQNVHPYPQQTSIYIQGRFEDCPRSQYQLTITQTSQNKLKMHFKGPEEYNRVYLMFDHNQNNYYYGLGEQFSYLSLGKDRPYSTLVREKGVGRTQQPLTLLTNLKYGAGGSYYTSYAPMPIWFSSQKMAYVLEDYSYMGWINNKMFVWNNQFDMILIKGETYKQLVRQVALINGYTADIPNWVNEGAIIGLQGGTQSVQKKYNYLKTVGAQIKGVWIQDWVAKRQSLGYSRLWWNWQLDQHHYQDWTQMQMKLNLQNVRTLLYINPMFSDPTLKQHFRQNYYKQALDKNYFVKLTNGEVFKTRSISDYEASLVDFQNIEGVKFFKKIIKRTIAQTNASGMMVDFAEAYPIEGSAINIEQGVRKHNQYPTLYHQKTNQIIKQLLGQNHQFYVFTRAGYLKSPKYAHSLWAGDQSMNFNFHTGLPSCLTAILSSGLVGYSNTHCDIGGYTYIKNDMVSFSERTETLMIHWMQLAAFTPVFRTHEGNDPEASLQVYSNQKLARQFAFYSKVFTALSGYRKNQTIQSRQQKIPLLRPLFLELNGRQGTQQIQDQFYLGSDILVSPYMGEKSERKYYLPKGQWQSIWDSKIYKGCDCERIWKHRFPPVLIKTDSPFQTTISKKIAIYLFQLIRSQPDSMTKEQL